MLGAMALVGWNVLLVLQQLTVNSNRRCWGVALAESDSWRPVDGQKCVCGGWSVALVGWNVLLVLLQLTVDNNRRFWGG